jgi:hypothetical protein
MSLSVSSWSGRARSSFPEFESLLAKRQGKVQLPRSLVSRGEVVHARERVGMIRAEMLFAQRERALQESDRSLVRADSAIRVSHGKQKLRLE